MKTYGLALKVALWTSLCAGVLVALACGTGLAWPWAALGVASILGLAVYAGMQQLVQQRIVATRTLLEHLRQSNFEALEDDSQRLAAPRRADEFDVLLAETRRTGRALGQQVQRLRSMENYRREFIGDVSHELKTPIFSIRGFAETLLEGALDDESVRRSFVEKIMRNADRLQHLASDLAEIAHIETGQLRMTVTSFALPGLVREVVESIEPTARAKSLRVETTLPGSLPPVEGDRERLRQVFTNLIDNAIKYNNKGGMVEVSAEVRPEGAVEVAVTDDGVGVEPEHLERLTERFYRVDRSRSRSQGGSGLGLAIVKHILGAHGSTLSIASTPGRGSTFSFLLPGAAGDDAVKVRTYGGDGQSSRDLLGLAPHPPE